MVQAQVGGQVLGGWDQGPCKVEPSLHGLRNKNTEGAGSSQF